MQLNRSPLEQRRSLELDYAPQVPMALLAALEERAREMGMPLHQLELLGQDRDLIKRFLRAWECGQEEDFLDNEVDWGCLEDRLMSRPPIFN